MQPTTTNTAAQIGRLACLVNLSPPTALRLLTVNAQIGRCACRVNLSPPTALGPPTVDVPIVSRERFQPLQMQSSAKYAPLPPTRTPVLATAQFVPVVLIWKRMVCQRMIALFVQQENIWKPAITEYTTTP